jgi:hypothetical protein
MASVAAHGRRFIGLPWRGGPACLRRVSQAGRSTQLVLNRKLLIEWENVTASAPFTVK